MTQREKTLAVGLVVVLGLAMSGGLLYFLALVPFNEANERLESEQKLLDDKDNELAKEKQQIAGIFKIDPRMMHWQDISLPPRDPNLKRGQTMTEEQKKRHVSQLQVDYEKYLSAMMRNNRFKPDSITVRTGQVEKQAVAKGKQPTYERIAFQVSGRGELSSVTGFMEEFHKAPLLHQIRNAKIEHAGAKGGAKLNEGELDMTATVEALLVTGANDRATLLPAKEKQEKLTLRVLADPPRDYDTLSAKNIFFGIKPPKPDQSVKTDKDKEKDRRKKEDPKDVLAFVKLTMLCYDTESDRWYATFYDQGKGGNEKRVSKALNELTIYDKYEYPSLDATVVYVDGKQLIFKVDKDKKFFRLRIGDFIYPAYPNQSMTSSELKELGISAN
jgi:hypothetical protein